MDGELRSKACAEFECALEDYLEGELEAKLVSQVTEHLRECGSCRDALELAKASSLLLRARREARGQDDPWFAGRTMQAIRAEEERLAEVKSFWKPMTVLAWRFAMSAGLAVIVLLAYGRVAHLGTPSDVAVRSAQVRDIFQDPMRPPRDQEEVLLMVETNHDK